MNKTDRAIIFRQNLISALVQTGLNQAQLADKAGIDRSTLGQLLKEQDPRLPNGHTLAEIAGVLGVSSDWLLGLSQEAQPLTTFLDGALNFTGATARTPMDANLAQWHQEAIGYKIRHVPTSLPDLLKTSAVLQYEYRDYSLKTGEQAIVDRDSRMDYARTPDTDMEICIPVERLQQFADGTHIWAGLSDDDRREQLAYMADRIDELYPRMRIYGFDLSIRYSVPLTVFGPKRAVIYLGQGYFVLNTSAHIRHMGRHFDDLVRHASIQAHDIARWIRDLI